MTIIYEPKGRAREYAALAANLYNTCSHGCRYCYAPAAMKQRFNLARDAHNLGIRTWVSLEPVIEPDQALEVVRQLHPYVDLWKVGPVTKQQTDVDWKQFKIDIEKIFKALGANYILKKELLKRAGL